MEENEYEVLEGMSCTEAPRSASISRSIVVPTPLSVGPDESSSVFPSYETVNGFIDAVWLQSVMKDKTVRIIPLLICLAGLTNSGRKEAVQQILNDLSPPTDPPAEFTSHHILATNKSNYNMTYVYAGLHLYNFGFQSCKLVNSSDEVSYKVPNTPPSIYQSELLNKHMKTLLTHFHEYSSKSCDKNLLDFVFTITRGAALIKIWDIKLSSNVFYFLRAFSGHLTNTRMWLFAELDDVLEELNSPDTTAKSPLWQSQLDYLLRCMRLCNGSTSHKRPCTVFACHDGQDGVGAKLNTFEKELQRVARQLNVTELKDGGTIPFNMKNEQDLNVIFFLKNLLQSLYSRIPIRLTWLFLRGALEHRMGIFMKKAELKQLAKECSIEDFEEFCKVFTSFGSIFDLSLCNHENDIIIIKTDQFLSKLSEAFDAPTNSVSRSYTQNGIITMKIAEELFGTEGETFMMILEAVGMVAGIPPRKYQEMSPEKCYYMPCARKKQERSIDMKAVRLLRNIRCPPNFVNFEVAFTNRMLKHSFTQLQSSSDENQTIIKICADNNSIITMTFRGDETELKVDPPSKAHILLVIMAIKEIAEHISKNHGKISYAFAIICVNDSKEYHRLPLDSKLCDECKTRKEFFEWIEALNNEPIPKNFQFSTDISFDDVIFITKELQSFNKEALTRFCKNHFDATYKASLSPWLNIMNLLMNWITKDFLSVPATKVELARKLTKWGEKEKDDKDTFKKLAEKVSDYFEL